MGGELQDNAEARAFTPADAGYPRLTVSNAEMAAFQGGQSTGVSVTEREQAMFANGFDLAQAGNIYGNADLLAHKPEETDSSDKTQIADKPQKKSETEAERHARIMKEHYAAGQNLDAFLQRPSVNKAEEMSPSFIQSVKELRDCKWKGDIKVWTGSPIENPDYSADYSLIEIDSHARPNRQIESFAHEAYHATHQDLDKLYGGQKPVSANEFINIKMHQEAGAFYREAMVNEELTSRPLNFDKTKTQYVFVNSKGELQTQLINDLIVRTPEGKPDETKSLAAIENFLRHHPSAIADVSHPGSYQKDENGNYRVNDYVAHYRSGYKGYVEHFAPNQKALHDKHYL